MRKRRLHQVVDSDLAADYDSEEEDFPLQGYRAPSRPFIPPVSRNAGLPTHSDPMRQAMAFAIIAVVILVVILLLVNWALFIKYGPWFLLGVAVVVVGVVAVRELGNHQHKSAQTDILRGQAQAIRARAKQIEDTLPFDGNGNLYERTRGYIAGQAPEYPELRSIHNTQKYTGVPGEPLQGMLPQGRVQRLTIEDASRHIKNQLESCLGSSLRNNGAPILADWSESHILIIGSTRMGKSCEAGNILHQAERTHSPAQLQIAMLDAEYKTSKLFEQSAHLLKLRAKGVLIPMHAKRLEEVPAVLHLLALEAERRDRLEQWELEEQPHVLAYFEEFLNTKKQLRNRFPKQFDTFLTDFNMLATRGVKLGIHLMLCAQVNYADEDLRDSMAQFSGLNIAFSVNPTAARSAGFVENEMLSANYSAKQQGQFVVESISGNDIGLAPDFDMKEKIKLLSEARNRWETSTLNHFPQGQTTITEETGNRVESGLKVDGNQFGNQFKTAPEANLDKKVQEVMDFLGNNPGANVGDVLTQVWNVKPGRSESYQKAREEYAQVQERITHYALRGMQQVEEE